MRRVWLALMGAAQRAYVEAGGEKHEANPADPYMTVLGYFNSLRELGGARRILEEEVQSTVRRYRDRRRIGETEGSFESRQPSWDVLELTSRVPTDKVADARRRLETPFQDRKQRVDSAIATNMISVGLDIPRLGLMVVLGQPKTHAEYIQATSRVGRDDNRPGLVVTLLNSTSPETAPTTSSSGTTTRRSTVPWRCRASPVLGPRPGSRPCGGACRTRSSHRAAADVAEGGHATGRRALGHRTAARRCIPGTSCAAAAERGSRTRRSADQRGLVRLPSCSTPGTPSSATIRRTAPPSAISGASSPRRIDRS